MLRDKGFFAKVKLPALASSGIARVPLSKLGISPAAYGDLQVVLCTTVNATVEVAKDSNGVYGLKFTGTGSVSANTIVYIYCQVVSEAVEVTAVADA